MDKDLIVSQAFDIKMKQNEMRYIFIDESSRKLENIYLLKNGKISCINIVTKQLNELEFSKEKPVLFISGSSNNKSLIILFENGKLYSLTNLNEPTKNFKIYYYKNLHYYLKEDSIKNNNSNKNFFNKIYKIKVNSSLNKVIIINYKKIYLWTKISEKENLKKNLTELTGYASTVHIEKERDNLIKNSKNYVENFEVIFGNNYYYGSYARVIYVLCEDINEINGTKLYLIDYLFCFERENKFKYYTESLKNRNINKDKKKKLNNNENVNNIVYKRIFEEDINLNEYKKHFICKYLYTYFIPRRNAVNMQNSINNYLNGYKNNENLKLNNNNQLLIKNIIMKTTYDNNITAIVINNCPNLINNGNNKSNKIVSQITLILFMTTTYKFYSYPLDKFIVKLKNNSINYNNKFSNSKYNSSNNNNLNEILTVSDICWINNDVFLLVQFSNLSFIVLNSNFNLINICEASKSISNYINNDNYIFILNYFKNCKKSSNHINSSSQNYNNDLLSVPKICLSSSRCRHSNYFVFYSKYYIVAFNCYTKFYENKLISYPTNISFGLNEIIQEIQYIQSNNLNSDSKQSILDTIKDFAFSYFTSLFKNTSLNNINNNILSNEDENINLDKDNIYINSNSDNSQIKDLNFTPEVLVTNFINLFRNLNRSHEINLSLISFVIGISKNLILYLVNSKEIWLCYLFINICENYLLKLTLLKKESNNVNNDRSLFKREYFNLLFNPYMANDLNLKCYNKISNRILLCKSRVTLIIYSLIEFRNSQAENINILYFILAKLIVSRLKEQKALEDLNLILKVIIRNWKYLKTENDNVGNEEYILNGLTMSYRTEILSDLTSKRLSRVDIQFDFFNDFYSVEDFPNKIELDNLYIKGDEENLINEYSYANNLGIIQKWMLFFINFFYEDTFDELKNYLIMNISQKDNSLKLKANISPDEVKLSKLIIFNIFIFISILQKYIINIIDVISYNNTPLKNIQDLNNNFIQFISPIDIPFIIFEFYMKTNKETKININQKKSEAFNKNNNVENSNNDNNNNKNNIENNNPNFNIKSESPYLQYEINYFLFSILNRYTKSFNMNIIDGLEFCEFLILKGFINENDENFINNKYTKHIKYIYSSYLFLLVTINKLNAFYIVDMYKNIFYQSIRILNIILRKDVYEYIFLIFTGYIKYFYCYLKSEVSNELKYKNNELLVNKLLLWLKNLFYFILKYENILVSENIIMMLLKEMSVNEELQFVFYEGAFYYLNENFSNNIINKILINFDDNLKLIDQSKDNDKCNINISNIEEINIFSLILNNNNEENINNNEDDIINKIFKLLFNTKINGSKSQQKINIILKNIIFAFNYFYQKDFATNDNNNIQNNLKNLLINKENIKGNLNPLYCKTLIKFLYNLIYLCCKLELILATIPDNNDKNNLSNNSKNKINSKINIGKYLEYYSLYIVLENDSNFYIENMKKIINYLNLYSNKIQIVNHNLGKICKNLIYGNLIHHYSNKIFLNEISNLLKQDENIAIEYDRILNSNYEKNNYDKLDNKIFLLLENEGFKNISNRIIKNFNEFINNGEYDKTINQNYIKNLKIISCKYEYLNTILSNIIGIENNATIEFNYYYEYIRNNILYNFIVKKESSALYPDVDLLVKFKINIDDLYEERQKKININDNNEIIKNINNNLEKNKINVDLIEIKNENKLGKKLKIKNKIAQYSYENEYIFKDYNVSISSTSSRINANNKSLNKNIYNKYISKLIRRIKRVYFNRFLQYMFISYKSKVEENELETIEVLNISIDKNCYQNTFLKEKYISLKDYESKSYFVEELSPYDIIKCNKFRLGKSENSQFYYDLINKKAGSRKLGNLIKHRVNRIKEDLNKFEKDAKDLGKDFLISNNK